MKRLLMTAGAALFINGALAAPPQTVTLDDGDKDAAALNKPAQRQYGIAFREEDGRIENPIRGINAQLMRNVEHMSYKRELDSAWLNADVEVAERHWMCHCMRREAEDQNEREQRDAGAHSPDALPGTQ